MLKDYVVFNSWSLIRILYNKNCKWKLQNGVSLTAHLLIRTRFRIFYNGGFKFCWQIAYWLTSSLHHSNASHFHVMGEEKEEMKKRLERKRLKRRKEFRREGRGRRWLIEIRTTTVHWFWDITRGEGSFVFLKKKSSKADDIRD